MAGSKRTADLDDLMLAMDVVDTLRHQQSLVEHALSADERESALKDRIRKIYLDQGIEVSDEVIANGVSALREERFSYAAPPGGMKTWLARCYVARARAYKPLLAIGTALALWWGANFAFSTLPEQRKIEAAMSGYNQQVVTTQNEMLSANGRLERAEKLLSRDLPVPPDMRDIAPLIKQDTELAIASARRLSADAGAQKVKTFTDADDFRDERGVVEGRLKEQQSLLAALEAKLSDVESGAGLLTMLGTFSSDISKRLESMSTVAKEPDVMGAANAHAENALAALKNRDAKTAQAEKKALESLFDEVKRTYQILIVSRPGEKTGVWRYPEDNNQVRNYYLVVEAVTEDGKRLKRAVVSEEDGKTHHVTQWAMRVDQTTYNKVADDKKDDGIVQNKLFGEKRRGYINPHYQVRTTGASIVNW